MMGYSCQLTTVPLNNWWYRSTKIEVDLVIYFRFLPSIFCFTAPSLEGGRKEKKKGATF